jgi:hypothetical protein
LSGQFFQYIQPAVHSRRYSWDTEQFTTLHTQTYAHSGRVHNQRQEGSAAPKRPPAWPHPRPRAPQDVIKQMTGWPSGLRRWIKDCGLNRSEVTLQSSRARVQIPSRSWEKAGVMSSNLIGGNKASIAQSVEHCSHSHIFAPHLVRPWRQGPKFSGSFFMISPGRCAKPHYTA